LGQSCCWVSVGARGRGQRGAGRSCWESRRLRHVSSGTRCSGLGGCRAAASADRSVRDLRGVGGGRMESVTAAGGNAQDDPYPLVRSRFVTLCGRSRSCFCHCCRARSGWGRAVRALGRGVGADFGQSLPAGTPGRVVAVLLSSSADAGGDAGDRWWPGRAGSSGGGARRTTLVLYVFRRVGRRRAAYPPSFRRRLPAIIARPPPVAAQRGSRRHGADLPVAAGCSGW